MVQSAEAAVFIRCCEAAEGGHLRTVLQDLASSNLLPSPASAANVVRKALESRGLAHGVAVVRQMLQGLDGGARAGGVTSREKGERREMEERSERGERSESGEGSERGERGQKGERRERSGSMGNAEAEVGLFTAQTVPLLSLAFEAAIREAVGCTDGAPIGGQEHPPLPDAKANDRGEAVGYTDSAPNGGQEHPPLPDAKANDRREAAGSTDGGHEHPPQPDDERVAVAVGAPVLEEVSASGGDAAKGAGLAGGSRVVGQVQGSFREEGGSVAVHQREQDKGVQAALRELRQAVEGWEGPGVEQKLLGESFLR